jgi:Orsellinic acid/F9775 biosynthesis cluster protein D
MSHFVIRFPHQRGVINNAFRNITREPHVSMDMSEQYLLYLNDFGVIVCRECQHGIVKGNIGRHFRMFHKNIDLCVRRELTEYVKDLEIHERKYVQTPTREVMAVEG